MNKSEITRENNKASILAFILILIISFITKILMGQETEWNYWTSVELNKDLNKKISLSFSPEVRFTNQFNVDEYFFEAGADYKLCKYLKVGGNYRFLINEREKKSTEYYGRIALDLKGKYEINKLGIHLRTRYCNYSEFDSEEDNSAEPYLRYRLKLKYNISKLNITPLVSMELFHQLNDNEINKTRTTVGLEYKMGKVSKLGLKYLVQNYLDDDYRKNILSLEYKISF